MSPINKMDHETLMNEKFWYALYTKSRGEFKAAEQIQALNIEYYLPTITKMKRWSDRKKKITEPIMRGYIFIHADERERLAAIEQYSIVRCVFDVGKPAKIPEWQIINLQNMLNSKGEFSIHEGLLPGTMVKINEGPFEGVIGRIQETPNGNTISVSIDLLNRTVMAYLPKESIFEVLKEKEKNKF